MSQPRGVVLVIIIVGLMVGCADGQQRDHSDESDRLARRISILERRQVRQVLAVSEALCEMGATNSPVAFHKVNETLDEFVVSTVPRMEMHGTNGVLITLKDIDEEDWFVIVSIGKFRKSHPFTNSNSHTAMIVDEVLRKTH